MRSDLGIYKSTEKIQIKATNWLKHVERMDDNRLPKLILDYKPTRRRTVGRPRQRWKHSLVGTVLRTYALKLMMVGSWW
jgi:hypothetical protein